MIPEGTEAPTFELPGLVGGEQRRVALDEFVGRDIVILAFYPADFDPACDEESPLAELDLFAMQTDVSVLAVGPDSLYSHAAFADEYDLDVPLLADTRREVAEAYDLVFEDALGQRLVQRAVVVIDPDGVIRYTWHARDLEALPPIEEIKDAVGDTGDDEAAFARYRVGHAHYTEGRRAFTSALDSYRDDEWMLAQSDFVRASAEFERAADHFDSSVRFVDDEGLAAYYERVQEKSMGMGQAADWLRRSASAYARGGDGEGRELRDDAERVLENTRAIGEPADPDDWPPDADREGIDPQIDASEVDLAVDEPPTGGGRIDDVELEAIKAEVAASQSGDAGEESVTGEDEPGDEGELGDNARQDVATADRADSTGRDEDDGDDEANDDSRDGVNDEVDDEDLRALSEELAGNASDDASDDWDAPVEGDGPPADPHADLASGSGMPPGVSGSLDPVDGSDLDDWDDEVELAGEPQGASDDDLADIPTTAELSEDGGDEDDPGTDGEREG